MSLGLSCPRTFVGQEHLLPFQDELQLISPVDVPPVADPDHDYCDA